MLNIYRTNTETGALERLEAIEPGCWVSAVVPTTSEREWLEQELGVVPEFMVSMMDDEERSHVDYDNDLNQTLVILDCPCVEDKSDTVDSDITQYDTHPVSVLFVPSKQIIVTVCLQVNDTIQAFEDGRLKELRTQQRTQMLLLLMLNEAQHYQTALRDVDRQFKKNEKQLRSTMRNREMIRMLGLEKSLVYFTISLRAMDSTLAKINAGRFVRMYEDDRDLADDVRIELRQAVEMCEISSKLLNETMDTFSNIINNNMNDTMKLLTIITLVLAVPTIVFSFYGMNVDDLPLVYTWLWPMGITIVGCIVAGLIFAKSRFFK